MGLVSDRRCDILLEMGSWGDFDVGLGSGKKEVVSKVHSSRVSISTQ